MENTGQVSVKELARGVLSRVVHASISERHVVGSQRRFTNLHVDFLLIYPKELGTPLGLTEAPSINSVAPFSLFTQEKMIKMSSVFKVEGEGGARPMEDLTDAIFNGDREERIQAAWDIRKRGSGFTKTITTTFGASVLIVDLVSMLRSEDFDAREASLYALLDLALRNQRSKIGIVKAGAVPTLAELLRQENRSLREPATTALLLLSTCTANRPTIAASGAIPLLAETVRTFSGNRQTKQEALTLLHNLSSCRQYIPAIIDAGIIPSLLYLLSGAKKSSKIAEKATALLESGASTETGRSEIAGVEGGILSLVETVEEGSGRSREHAVGALLAMCEGCREMYGGLILNEGVIPGLLQLSVLGSRRSQERAGTLLKLLREWTHGQGVLGKLQN